jgi:ribosomal-protein-alanine N-acetyltransferase
MSSRSDPVQVRPAIPVRGMTSADVQAVLSILRESPETSQWSESSIQECAANGRAWVSEVHGAVAGFLIGRLVADEFEILNMAVARGHRRRGIAGELLRHSIQQARESGARRVHLEVRASNESAIRVYVRHSFSPGGRRVRYYQDPPEDALLFSLELESTEN